MRARPMAMVSALLALFIIGCATGRRDRQLLEQQRAELHTLEARIVALDADAARLRSRLESLEMQNDSLKHATARTESDIRDREELIRALRLELQRLKEIDLRPRPNRSLIPHLNNQSFNH